jgi:hypothetical protein
MKYIITESQFENAIFIYLNKKNFIQVENKNSIYFVKSEGDKYAKIKYEKNNELCIIYYELINEISSFFSLNKHESENTIGQWVENTLQMNVTDTLKKGIGLNSTELRMKVSDTVGQRVINIGVVENTL